MATKQHPRGIDEGGRLRGFRNLRNGVSGGIATVLSGTSAITVTNAYVQSGDNIQLSLAPSTFGAVTSNHGVICVRTINPGVDFIIGNTTAVALPWPVDVHWMIHKL